jgi:hypothetical protein
MQWRKEKNVTMQLFSHEVTKTQRGREKVKKTVKMSGFEGLLLIYVD